MELTPEEREAIYQEEKARIEARGQIAEDARLAEQAQKAAELNSPAVRVLTVLALLAVGYLIYTFSSNPSMRDSLTGSVQSAADAATGTGKYTIRLSGTDGLKFSGCYLVVEAGGANSSKSVEGTLPKEYEVVGMITSCAFQKQAEQGLLRVDLIKDSSSIKGDETTAAYGMVSVAK